MGPINGMYGIEDATGNVNVWNSGELFGAIDVALFVLIIGGFLGVTMKTGAINAGIAWVVTKLKGKEKWMFPVLMTIFAIGGTSYGMAEETLAFYALIITVMLAAGYDGLAAAALILLGAGHRRDRFDRQPLCHRHRLGLCRHDHQRRPDRADHHPGHRHDHSASSLSCATPRRSRRTRPSRSSIPKKPRTRSSSWPAARRVQNLANSPAATR